MPNQQQNSVLKSIESLNKQCYQAWQEAEKIPLPPSYKKVKNIVVAGMGGSALGARIIKAVFKKELKTPFEIVNHYNLPAWVGPDTLVFLISYSGGTEETLAAAKDAQKKRAKILVVASGGKLADLAKKFGWPAYIFSPIHNPSGQPRLGLGYLLVSQMAFLKKLGFLKTPPHLTSPLWGEGRGEGIKNSAKKFALALQNKAVVLVGSEHLLGNLHTLANQINENAKQMSLWFPLPEINHHLLEGLTFPVANQKYLKFVFFESGLYHPRVGLRYPLTREVLKKQGIETLSWRAKSKTRLSQVFELLAFGSFVSFYLAILNQVDPGLVPWVDYFKKKMG